MKERRRGGEREEREEKYDVRRNNIGTNNIRRSKIRAGRYKIV